MKSDGVGASGRGLIVVPAYNEERNILSVLDGFAPYRSDFDVLVVNDGSSDATEGLVRSAGVLQAVLPCNLGYSRAVGARADRGRGQRAAAAGGRSAGAPARPRTRLEMFPVLDARSRQRGYFRPEVVRRYLDEHVQGRGHHHFRLWNLLMLELWHRMFSDQPCPAAPPGRCTWIESGS